MPTSALPAVRWLAESATSGPATAAHIPALAPLDPPASAQPPEDVAVAEAAAGTGVGGVEPNALLPTGFAKLVVTRVRDPAGQELFGLAGKSDVRPLDYTVASTQLRPPDIGLGNVSGEGEYPSEIWRAIWRWSKRQQPLTTWIAELRVRHGDDLQFLVWDDTDYDIPWELLWLDEDRERGLAGGCLGALVNVTRWTTIREVDRSPIESAECSGGVLGYFDKTMEADAIAFESFLHQRYQAIDPFLDELERDDLSVGLIYMACHGEYGSSVYRLRLNTVTWGELDGLDMAALRGWPTVVCLNACHSGRLVRNVGQGEEALRGFAELFLRKGAYACIASAGKVGDDEAHALILQLIEEVTATPTLPLAVALRRFRQQAVAALPWNLPRAPRTRNDDGSVNRAAQKQQLRFLYSFMFLYYGHPLTTLRLSAEVADESP